MPPSPLRLSVGIEDADDRWADLDRATRSAASFPLDAKIVCFFQAASKFNMRYATLGFQHDANLGEGAMWPTAFALIELTPSEEERIAALVKRAAS